MDTGWIFPTERKGSDKCLESLLCVFFSYYGFLWHIVTLGLIKITIILHTVRFSNSS